MGIAGGCVRPVRANTVRGPGKYVPQRRVGDGAARRRRGTLWRQVALVMEPRPEEGHGSMSDSSTRAAFCPPWKVFYEAEASHPNANSCLAIFFFR